ncbi:MAG: DNA mismatch repair protein MutS2 [Chloroflexi bacterium]|jgi:DNA mismatch repair protein MutS2|nr:MAG: DNA mismatch repair protein MutS2 [Chloroflexota bacterium]
MVNFDPEIHLRHLPVEDALYKLEKYLDSAFVNEIGTVRVVHGKGSGAVSRAVWDLLKTHPLVKDFRFADHGEGDYGVTITEMEER